ncbi:unnamed protein product, partial [Amoebophrya sp. A25]
SKQREQIEVVVYGVFKNLDKFTLKRRNPLFGGDEDDFLRWEEEDEESSSEDSDTDGRSGESERSPSLRGLRRDTDPDSGSADRERAQILAQSTGRVSSEYRKRTSSPAFPRRAHTLVIDTATNVADTVVSAVTPLAFAAPLRPFQSSGTRTSLNADDAGAGADGSASQGEDAVFASNSTSRVGQGLRRFRSLVARVAKPGGDIHRMTQARTTTRSSAPASDDNAAPGVDCDHVQITMPPDDGVEEAAVAAVGNKN